MRLALCTFIIGVLSLRFLPCLPSPFFLILLGCLGLALLPWRFYPIGLLLIGFVWGGSAASFVIGDRLDRSLDGQTLWLEGKVVGLPEYADKVIRFQLDHAKNTEVRLPKHIRFSWYQGEPLETGERWRLKVRLKYPRGTVNPNTFDYEQWLTAKHIGSTGTVKEGYRLEASAYASNWRYLLKVKINQHLPEDMRAGIVALVLGDGSGLTKQQWQVLQETGTVHLMVISGQHITLLAGFIYFWVVCLVRLGLWPTRIPWLPVACGLAMLGALGYGLLAGFEVPVRRACIMLALVFIWRLRFRHLGIVTPFLMVLAIVLAVDPLASLQAGFWLSFCAVAILLLVFSGRLSRQNWLLTAIKLEVAITIGLLPILLALLLPVSLTAPIANLIAVPVVSFIVVPLALLGTLFLFIPFVGTWLLWLAGAALKSLFCILGFMASIIPAWIAPVYSVWTIPLALLGVFLILLPRGLLVRGFGFIFCFPLFFTEQVLPEEGRAEVVVFDVGQGTSVLIKTKTHALLYDTGPSFGDFNVGERVVLPAMRRQGITKLDTLVISHADTDHAGGLQAIEQSLNVLQIISGEVSKLNYSKPVSSCQNASWWWDGVKFTLWQWQEAKKSNDLSCVLLVEAQNERLLLTGDVSAKAEQAWVKENPIKIHWLLAAHHGSRQSSSGAFLAAIKPETVLFSRGWLNPFHHPHPDVILRYNKVQANIEDTAVSGALVIKLGDYLPITRARDTKKFWRKE